MEERLASSVTEDLSDDSLSIGLSANKADGNLEGTGAAVTPLDIGFSCNAVEPESSLSSCLIFPLARSSDPSSYPLSYLRSYPPL